VVEDESQHILITLFARGFFAYKMAQKLTIGWIFHTIIIEKRRLLRSCIFYKFTAESHSERIVPTVGILRSCGQEK